MLSFKHVGVKQYETRKIDTVDRSIIPVGIKTPLRFSFNGTDVFEMNFSTADQIEDNLRNLIQTNFGERVGRYNYGANLQELTLEFTNKEDFDAEAMLRINTAVSTWMPFIELSGFESNPIFDDNRKIGKMGIIIEYSVEKALIFSKRMEIILYVS